MKENYANKESSQKQTSKQTTKEEEEEEEDRRHLRCRRFDRLPYPHSQNHQHQ